MIEHVIRYMGETIDIAQEISDVKIEELVQRLVALRERKGRLWLAGLGGSAANASHAANDFNKLCGIEAYCITDNVAKFTAWANDSGWDQAFRLEFAKQGDALFVFSVGGGTETVSVPICDAVHKAQSFGMTILGIVGRDGGYTAQHGDCVVIVPTVEPSRVTPHTEGWQSVILHCVVSHPDLQRNRTKW